MKNTKRFAALATAIAAAAALSACGTPPYATSGEMGGTNGYPPYGGYYPDQRAGYYPDQRAGYVEYGRITEVALISNGTTVNGGPGAPNNGAATVAGAVVGGVVGNQFGHGGGRAAATILGAIGGAAIGNNLSRNTAPSYSYTGPVYRVTVQTDSGVYRSYDVGSTGDLRPGDRVRIENGVIYLG